ncbi:MAG TPA: 23S rRNA (guanosine(2251)-2'-O)-methyltransferase RlmB [bacterium]|jgi:23S rRNA (guanosine2251-2'-O)-methyltransferase
MPKEDLVYGPHSVRDALEGGRVKKIWLLKSKDKGKAAQARNELASAAQKSGIKVDVVPKSYLDSRMGRSNHQGIIASVKSFEYADLDDELEKIAELKQAMVIVLDGIQDPGNFGHIIRQAAGFAASLIVIPERRAVDVTPTVEKASAGTSSQVPIAIVSNIVNTVKKIQGAGMWTYALDMSGKKTLQEADFPEKAAIVLGGEHDGVSRLVMETCDEVIHIPKSVTVESFNVATSAAVAMYEYRRKYSI